MKAWHNNKEKRPLRKKTNKILANEKNIFVPVLTLLVGPNALARRRHSQIVDG